MRAGAASLAAALLLMVSCGGDDDSPEPQRPGVRGALGGSASTRTLARVPSAARPEGRAAWVAHAIELAPGSVLEHGHQHRCHRNYYTYQSSKKYVRIVTMCARRAQGRPRSREIDQRILEAALEVMSRDGYARMSMDAVARQAGVTRPTVYLRYTSKAELASAAVAAFQARDLPRPSGDTRADLIAQLRHFRRGIERPHGVAMVGTVLAEEPHTPELLETWRERVVGPRRAALRAVLEEARAGGEVRSDADLDRVVSMLIGSYYAAYLAGRRPPRSWPAQEVDIVLSGLRQHCKAPEHEVGTWTSSSPEVTGRSGSGC